MKKKDLILITVLVLIFGVGYFVFQMIQGDKDVVKVYYQKQVIQEINIDKDDIYHFKGSYGTFTLEVKDQQYRAINVECPNHDCEKVGWVGKGSLRQIVCVPNDIYVMQEEGMDQIK